MTRTDSSLAVVVALLAVLVLLPLLFMGVGMLGFGSMMGGYDHGMWGTGGGTGWPLLVGVVVQLAFLAAIVVVGYLVYRAVTDGGGQSRAMEELRVAYARGEIDDEEYERRRETLDRDS